jgi:hypothetical protein
LSTKRFYVVVKPRGGFPPGSARTLWKLQTALEKAGVEFIPEDDLKGPGVRLKESTRSKARRKRK